MAQASTTEVSPTVEMAGVTKHYRGGGGIDDVDLEVVPGEVFAFLGPNGAGKTTAIRLLLDLIRPDAGRIRVFGRDPRKDGVEVRRRIGYLPGEFGLYGRLTARELLTHFAHLRGGPPWPAIAALTERFDVDVDRPLRALSKGNRQKVGLVQALMGEPALLILDEPTSGLDPLVQQQVHDLIRAAAVEGRTVFLSSHVLSEVDRVADRVGFIKDGRVISVTRVADMRARSVHLVDVRFMDAPVPPELTGLPGVRLLASGDRTARLEVSGSIDGVVAVLSRHRLADLAVREPSLEEFFLRLFDDEPSGAARPEDDGAGA